MIRSRNFISKSGKTNEGTSFSGKRNEFTSWVYSTNRGVSHCHISVQQTYYTGEDSKWGSSTIV